MMGKLTAQSPARRLLLSKFQSGEITGKEDPKVVWESNDVFQQHKLANFRVHYNNIRKNPPSKDGKFALSMQLLLVSDVFQDENVASLVPRSSEQQLKRIRPMEPASVPCDTESGEEEECDADGSGAELTIGDSFFKPLYLVGVWEEPATKTKRINVVIVLPSGIDKNDFALSVSEGGKLLQLQVTWPDPIVSLELLHQKWLRNSGGTQKVQFTMFHPAVLSLEDALKARRERANDFVVSTARIPLPFPVQTHIEGQSNLFFKETSTKIVYVELKAMVESYAVSNNQVEFEEF